MTEWLAGLPERDGWDCFVAYDGSVPAASGALFISEGCRLARHCSDPAGAPAP